MELPFLYKIGYMRFTAFNENLSFYFAWTLTDLVCISSGMGFHGYDCDGKSKWDLLTNFNIFKIEVIHIAIRSFFFILQIIEHYMP
jgi:hypothetical protein